MPVVVGRTREQLRQAIGYNIGGIYVSDTSGVGLTTTIVDDTLIGGTDNYKGNWVIATSGTNDGEITRVSSFTGTTLTVSPAFGATTPSAMTYEMFSPEYPPVLIHDLINQAILDATGVAFDREEDLTLHGDGRQASFAIPTEFAMLDKVSYRAYHESVTVEPVTAAWSELLDTGLTAVIDTKDYKTSQSMKITAAAGAAANARITQAITSLDISGYDYIEFWIKSTFATLAGGIHLLLDDTAQAASALETLAVPALTANVWQFVRIALANPQSDTALISVGLRFTTDNGAQTAWLGEIRAVRDDTARWTLLNHMAWGVDGEARTLKLRGNTAAAIGARLLKIEGGDKPALLTTDAGVNEIDDWYVICRATELALSQNTRGTDAVRELRSRDAARWGRRADSARSTFAALVNARMVS